MQNAKCKMAVCLRHLFKSSPKGIPSFCILHSEFCISMICWSESIEEEVL